MTDTHNDINAIDLLIRSDDTTQLNNKKQKRHSAIVRRMRLILPVAAFAIVIALMTWKDESAPVSAIPREEVSPQTVSQNELINPKFQSEDQNNQPYTITADKATQNADDMDILHLQKPVADITLKSGGWVSLKAKNGVYQQEDKNLNLDGDVVIHDKNGYEIQTQKINIQVKDQMITSTSPVTGRGPEADISASGLSVDGQSKIVIFTGPAKLTFKKEDIKGQKSE